MKKILVINPFGIGDVIFSTPLVEILKKNFPDSFIGYVCNKRVSGLMEANPHIKKVYIYEKDDYRNIWHSSRIACIKKIWELLKFIRGERFDVSIDLSLTYHYSMLLKLIGVRERLGFNYRNRGKFLTRKINIDGFADKHVVEYYLDLLRPLDIDPFAHKPQLRVFLNKKESDWADGFLKANGITDSDMVIGIVPGCGASWGADAKYRRWDKSNFAKVADKIAKRHGAKIVLFGNLNELEICHSVKDIMKHDAIMACGETTLCQFLGLLSKCMLVITNDGGPLHMAVGLGVKTVSIFGPVDEKVYGPYPPGPRHIVVSHNGVSCRPCYKKFKYTICSNRMCLKEISPEEVLSAVEKILSQ